MSVSKEAKRIVKPIDI